MEEEKTLAEIKVALDEIKNEITKNNKIIMQRLNSLYEYNEINDMRARVFSKQLEMLKNEITKKNWERRVWIQFIRYIQKDEKNC